MLGQMKVFRTINKPILWASFCFAIICFGPIHLTFGWQSPSPEARIRIERATHKQWSMFVATCAVAVLGDSWQQDIGAMPPEDLANQERLPWLSERIEKWTQSQSFIEEQTRSWIADRCGGEVDTNELWDFRLHDDWVRTSIARNESFLIFVQGQLAGDVIFDAPEARLGTATWFRCLRCPPSLEVHTSLAEHARAEHARHVYRSPTMDQLPANLTWTALSRKPWLYCEPSESQRTRLLDLESSMLSVLKTEQRDWHRLLRDPAVAQWHRAQSGWPLPNPVDKTFDLSQQIATSEGSKSLGDPHPSYTIENPWRYTEPWTVLLEFEVVDTDAKIPIEESFGLVRQRSSCPDPSTSQQSCAIDWYQGKILMRWIHSLPHSYLALETEPVFRSPGTYSLAIVYDGFPSAAAVRVWTDGVGIPMRATHDCLVRDFASSEKQVIEVLNASKDSRIQIKQLECYRSALSALEVEGWRQVAEWKEWEACSEEEQQAAREHYARRLDLQWRYQRESLLFYANSFGSVAAQVEMVPVLERGSKSDLLMPEPFAAVFGLVEDRQAWSPDRRRTIALGLRDQAAVDLAGLEVSRQSRRMLASVQLSDQRRGVGESMIREEVAESWSKSWDRWKLIRAILLSDGWLAIALDSLL